MLKGEVELKAVVSSLQSKIEQEEDPTLFKQVLAGIFVIFSYL